MGALDYLGAVTPSTRQIAAEVVAHLDSIGKPLPVYPDMGSQVIWGKGSSSEHATGRALDFMVQSPANGVGDEIAAYMFANADRFGLIHVLWRQRIRSTRTQPGVWRPMADRGSSTENHLDHPHCFFDGRAIKGKPSAPATGSTATVQTYTRDDVKRFQRVHGLNDDGYWGKDTEKQAQAIRRVVKPRMKAGPWDLVRYWRLIYTRPKGKRTASSLRAGIQWALDVDTDGIWGPATDAAWLAIRAQHKMKGV